MNIQVYISKNKDTDLYKLVEKYGKTNVTKMMKYSLKSMVDVKYIDRAKEYLIETEKQEYPDIITLGFALNNQKDEKIINLLNKTLYKKKSLLIKTILRFILGPEIIIPLLLNINDSPMTTGYKQLIITDITPQQNMMPMYYPMPIYPNMQGQGMPMYYPMQSQQMPAQPQMPVQPMPAPVAESESIETPEKIEINTEIEETTTSEEPMSSEDNSEEILAMLTNILA